MKPAELWGIIFSAIIVAFIGWTINDWKTKTPHHPEPPAPAPRPVPVVKWHADSYEEALQLSAAHHRRVVCLFSAAWCPACVRLEQRTLRDDTVNKKLAAEFIFVKLDADARRDLGRRYGVTGIPAMLQLDSAGAELRRHVGFMSASEFCGWLGATEKLPKE